MSYLVKSYAKEFYDPSESDQGLAGLRMVPSHDCQEAWYYASACTADRSRNGPTKAEANTASGIKCSVSAMSLALQNKQPREALLLSKVCGDGKAYCPGSQGVQAVSR